MFEVLEAHDLACALVLLGFDAYATQQGDLGHGIWCEDAGLLFQSRVDLDCWLGRYLSAKTAQEVINFG